MIAPAIHNQDPDTFDVIIIGAGINGAGIARDAAMRGLAVLLLDKGDIAGGTSAWSTRLIHGGLRYLEYAEIGLVRESLRERELLLQSAPHLVRPLPILIPIYRTGRFPLWKIRAGLIAYDILSFDRSMDHHHILTRKHTLQRLPGLNPDQLHGSAIYYDAQAEYAERLVIENVLAAKKHGAAIRTWTAVKQLIIESGHLRGVEYITPEGAAGRALARIIINAAGPWVDEVARLLPHPPHRMLGGAKGSHIVVDPFPNAPAEGLYAEARDGRPFFILPWTGRYLIGTTDIRYEGNLDELSADPTEIDYLLHETNRAIPAANLTRDSILFSYSGVRPLPYQSAATPGAITRRHLLRDHAQDGLPGMLTIIGGKLTTYRSLAEKTVDAVVAKLALSTIPCATRKTPLPGASCGFERTSAILQEKYSSLSRQTLDHLLRVYGTRAAAVLAIANSSPDLLDVFDPHTGAIAAEVIHAVQEEFARTLTDILLRRTMVGLGPEMGIGADTRAAEIAGRHLGWNDDRIHQEIAAYRHFIARFQPRSLPSATSPKNR